MASVDPYPCRNVGFGNVSYPVTAGRRMSATTAAELMTTPVLTVAEDDYPGDVAEGMADRGFKSV